MLKIRKPYFAGKLYPFDKLNLEREIAIFLESAVQNMEIKNPWGIILPHGGYRKTGGIIARALTYFIDIKIESIILLAPFHKYSEKKIEIYNGDGYDTPLGSIPVDKMLINELKSHQIPDEYFGSQLHESDDFAMEINLPFFQEVFGNFRLLPIYFSNHISYGDVAEFVQYLLKLPLDEKYLVISTVNLSKDKPYDEATKHDQKILELLKQKKLVTIQKEFEKGNFRICGIKPLSAQLLWGHKKGIKKIEIINYRNTGDIDGKKEKTSGYFSAILF